LIRKLFKEHLKYFFYSLEQISNKKNY